MKLAILTIVLDGMKFLPAQLFTLNRLKCDWTWYIVEGAANNGGSTSWCKPQDGRLSRDGTTEFLHLLRDHPRIRILQRQCWPSKDDMCNAALELIKEPCCLLQMDVDEIWTSDQLELIAGMFNEFPSYNVAHFYCRFFVGPNIIINHESDKRNNRWFRAFRFKPGSKFIKHEPPVLENAGGLPLEPETTLAMGLMFDHYAYVLPSQVAFKEAFYGYKNALANWQKLQRNTKWPVKLKQFLPWCHPDSIAEKLHK